MAHRRPEFRGVAMRRFRSKGLVLHGISRFVVLVAVVVFPVGCTPIPTGGSSAGQPVSSESPTGPPSAPTPMPRQSSWEDIIEQSRDAVVQVYTTHCDASQGRGSGFVVGEDLIMTAAHVVDDASSVTVHMPSGLTLRTELIDFDHDTDSALLRTESSTHARPLVLSPAEVRQSAELRVLGYPLHMTQMNATDGTVGAVHEQVEYETFTVSDVFTTNAETNRGNSGGPVLDRSGRVIGLVSGSQVWDDADLPVQGLNFIVPSTSLARNLAGWQGTPARGVTECDPQPSASPTGSSSTLEVSVETNHEDARDLAMSLFIHGDAINQSDYRSAWNMMTPAQQRRQRDLDRWAGGLGTTLWTNLIIRDVIRDGTRAEAEVQLTTEQAVADGFQGQTCSVHDITYDFVLAEGVWLMDYARRPEDPTPCP